MNIKNLARMPLLLGIASLVIASANQSIAQSRLTIKGIIIQNDTGIGGVQVGDPFTMEMVLFFPWNDSNSDPGIGFYQGIAGSGADWNFQSGSFRAGLQGYGQTTDFSDTTVTDNSPVDSILFEALQVGSTSGDLGASELYLEFSSPNFLSSDAMPPSIFADGADLADAFVDLGGKIIGEITGVYVDVQPELESLVLEVQGCNLANGISNSLDTKLANAFDAWVAENFLNRQDVANKLSAFINSVDAQRGNKIPNSDADFLITKALAIVAKL